MGWNSWNTFEVNISEDLIREIADILVSSGMKDAGYTYLVIDDGWEAKTRDEKGNLVADPEKFPNGMKAVSDYVHAKGLKSAFTIVPAEPRAVVSRRHGARVSGCPDVCFLGS
jgi:alpha-galactosidase